MTTDTIEKPADADALATCATRCDRTYRPAVDIIECADELTVHADMPGTSAEQIEISLDNGTLTLRAAVKDRPAETAGYRVREYGVGDFCHSFAVGDGIDVEGITADYAHGVLTLHLPKRDAAKQRRIAVKAG